MAYENYGTGVIGDLWGSGVPVAGTDEVQTLTIGGTPTGGGFRISAFGRTSASIAWAGVNATLLAALNAQLDALFGSAQAVATAGTLAAGIGTILITFSGGNVSKRPQAAIGIAENTLTGTSPTLAVARTTPGVNPTGRGMGKGSRYTNTATGILYVNTGTGAAPVYVVAGTQV